MRLRVSVSEDGGGPADEGGGGGGGGGYGRDGWQRDFPRSSYHASRRRSPPVSRSRSHSVSRSPPKSRSRPRSRSQSKTRSESDIPIRTPPKRKLHSSRKYSTSSPTRAPYPVDGRHILKSPKKKQPPSPARSSRRKTPMHKKAHSPSPTSRTAGVHRPISSPPPNMQRPRTEAHQRLRWSERLSHALPRCADDSASTMYFSPPDQLTAQASADLEMLMGMLRCRARPTSAPANNQDELCDPAPPRLDPLLEQYVMRLLNMSKSNIESLNVSSSNVSVRSEVVECRNNMCTAETQTSAVASHPFHQPEDLGGCRNQRSVGVAVSPEQLLCPCCPNFASCAPSDMVYQPYFAPAPVSSRAPATTLVHSGVPSLTSVPAPRPSSPKTPSPKLSSQKLSSPEFSSQKLSSPKPSSSKLPSPKISSPKLSSPKLSSPKLSSPKPSTPKPSSTSIRQTQRLRPVVSRVSKPVFVAKQPLQNSRSPTSSNAPLDSTEYLPHELFSCDTFRRVPASAPPADPAVPHLSPDYRSLAAPAASRPLRVEGGAQPEDASPSVRSDCPSLCCPCNTVLDGGPQAMQKAWRSVASDVIKMSERCAKRIESLARLIEHVRLEKDKLAHLDAKPDPQQTPIAPVSTLAVVPTAYPAAPASVLGFGGRPPSPVCDAIQMSPHASCASCTPSRTPPRTPPRTPARTPPCTPPCIAPRTPTRSSPTASSPGRCLQSSPGQAMAETAEDKNELWFQIYQRQQSARPVDRQHQATSSSTLRLAASLSSSPQRTAVSLPQHACIPSTCPHTVPVSTLRIPRVGTTATEQQIFENENSSPQPVQEVSACDIGDGDPLWVFTPDSWPPVDEVPAPVHEQCASSCNFPCALGRGRCWSRSKPPTASWGPRVPHTEQHELSAIPEVDSTLMTDISHRRSPSPVPPPQASSFSQLVDIVSGDKTKFYTGPRENLHGLLIATHMAAQESQPWVSPGDPLPPNSFTSACPPGPLSQSPCPVTPRAYSPREQCPFARSPSTQSPHRTPRAPSPPHQSPRHQNLSPSSPCDHSPRSHATCSYCSRMSSPPPLQQQHEDNDDPDIVAELIRRGVLRSPFAWMKRTECVPQNDVDVNLSIVSGTSSDFVNDLLNSGSSSSPRRVGPSRSTSSPEQPRQRGGADALPSVHDGLASSRLPTDGTSPMGDVLPEDLEGMFERLGLGWAASMLRKTQEAMAISSSSSETSRGAKHSSCGGGGGNTSGPLTEDGVNRSDAAGTSFVPRRGHSTPVEVTAISDGSGSASWQRGHVTGNSYISSVPGASSQELSTPSVSLVVKSKDKSDSRT